MGVAKLAYSTGWSITIGNCLNINRLLVSSGIKSGGSGDGDSVKGLI